MTVTTNSITDMAFYEFSEMGKIAVILELKLRLLANKIPQVQSYAHAHSISETETALLPYLLQENLISDDEKKHIELSRKIRNKIFHCEFENAVKFIEELRGSPMPAGKVTGAKIEELPGNNILEKIMNFADSVQTGKATSGTFKVDQVTTKEAGIFGWLLDAYSRGVLREGCRTASDSLSVLDRIFNEIDKASKLAKE